MDDTADMSDAPVSGSAGMREQAWPSERAAWYAIAIMGLCTMFAFLDLNIVSLLVQYIKKDLAISDTKMSLVMGLSFAVFYTFIGLPISRYVDRSSRRRILSLGVAVWSLATALCGLAQNFWQLFAARVFVGAGEAVNGPAVYSMISDFFRKERLPRAIAVMQLGTVAGTGFSLIFGAVVIKLLIGVPDQHIPGIGTIHWWQLVFIAIGLPGLIVAALVRTMVEPPRRGSLAKGPESRIELRTVFRYLSLKGRVFGPMFGGLAISSLGMGASQMWMPTFYFRTYGWSPARVGAITGPIQIVASLIGLFLGAWLAEQFSKRGRHDASLRVVIAARIIGIPAAILTPLMPNPWLAVGLAAVSTVSIAMGGACQNAALQIVTPNEMRGQVTALYLFLFNVVGLALSPVILALLTDYVFQAESQIRYAILTSAMTFGPISLFVIWLGLKPFGQEVVRLKTAGV
jgi:MFS family permease